jgi:hypothetical protein
MKERRAMPSVDWQRRDTGEILVLSSSLLIDRVLQYTNLLEALSNEATARVWALSNQNPSYRPIWQQTAATIEDFPQFRPFKEFPYNYLRRLNEFAWDFRQRPASRLSMARHVRDKATKLHIRALKLPARLVAALGMEAPFEDWLEKLMLGYHRSEEALERLRCKRPKLVVVTGPFQMAQPAVASVAKNLGIPVMALITSWDNLSTKNRMVFKYDGYLVWSEQTRRELHHFYPSTRKAPVFVVGAPQFDVFFQDRFSQSRREFCETQGLSPDLPVIVYAVGSPNFLKGEWLGALHMAERIAGGELGNVQMIVRPHPTHDRGELVRLFERFLPRVVVQKPAGDGTSLPRSQDVRQTTEWVNTFRHADVVVNLSSTVMVDAALFDRPVVNLDFDPSPGRPQQQLIKEINHNWDHTKPVAESGGVWLVNDEEELVAAVKTYLKNPELHREKRRWIAEYVCQYPDGSCGERMARAIHEFADLMQQADREGARAAVSRLAAGSR